MSQHPSKKSSAPPPPPPPPPSRMKYPIETFGVPYCPECWDKECRRPVREVKCGHVKCASCYIRSEEGCLQCVAAALRLCRNQPNF